MTPSSAPAVALVASILALSVGSASAQPAPAPLLAPEPAHAFDFWLGQWTLTDGRGGRPRTAVISPAPHGIGLLEEIREGGKASGFSFNIYDPGRSTWTQLWTSPNIVVRLEGAPRAGAAMQMEGVITQRDGRGEQPLRVVWTVRGDGAVLQDFYNRSGGEGWKPSFSQIYTRPE